jgi:hypothetical protein
VIKVMAGLGKRKEERFDLAIPTCLSTIDTEGEEVTFELLTSNICSGGVYFKTDKTLPVGTRVHMDMLLLQKQAIGPGDKSAHVKVAGDVIRTDGKGMAVCLHKRFRMSSLSLDME